MSSTTKQKFFLKDYQSPAFAVDKIDLFFNLDEESTSVHSKLKLTKLKNNEDLVLDGKDLELVSFKVNGTEFSKFDKTESQLIIKSDEINKLHNQFELEVITKIYPHQNTSLEGLYKTNNYYVTQCEAQSFKKITYYFDRPDVMAKYNVIIEADKNKYPVLLSNGDRLWSKDLANGRHQVAWQDPHKKPCYLFALVAGDLGLIKDQFVTKSGKKVDLEIYAAHGKQHLCDYAMLSLKNSMKWDEERFGLEYDLNNYMIVAADDFNAGAMENKGLNIFNSKLVFADKKSATDADYEAIESVIGHEYFHNWTGNRITCRDWFQLSLKEGLTVYRDQEFSADLGSRAVNRISNVQSLRHRQFAEDAGPNAHPVRPEEAMAIDNFYTATIYEKGAEVIRMMQTMVGRPGFRKGMDLYFKRHDGQAVTTDDFVKCISEANNKDWTQFKLWYNQAGTPEVTVNENYDQNTQTYTLTLEQFCRPTKETSNKKPFHIPLMFGLLDQNGNDLKLNEDFVDVNTENQTLLHLKDTKQTFTFKNIKSKPKLSINRDFSAPINLKQDLKLEDYLFLMEHDTDTYNRWESSQNAYTLIFNQTLTKVESNQTPEISEKYFKVLSKLILDENLEPGFRATLLENPNLEIIAQGHKTFNVSHMKKVETLIDQKIAEYVSESALAVYTKLKSMDLSGLDSKTFGLKRLKNNSLILFMSTANEKALNLAHDLFNHANNMTDQYDGIRCIRVLISKLESMKPNDTGLINTALSARNNALEKFYNEWQNDPIVLNKWFSVQSSSTNKDTFKLVKELVSHPKFNILNPNNVYSLLRNFGGNFNVFYDSDSEVIEFYVEQILKIDKSNPQVAARMCAAFNYWDKVNEPNKSILKSAREKIAKTPGISANTFELVN